KAPKTDRKLVSISWRRVALRGSLILRLSLMPRYSVAPPAPLKVSSPPATEPIEHTQCPATESSGSLFWKTDAAAFSDAEAILDASDHARLSTPDAGGLAINSRSATLSNPISKRRSTFNLIFRTACRDDLRDFTASSDICFAAGSSRRHFVAIP